MPRRRPKSHNKGRTGKSGNGANLGFAAQLWAAADKLRGNMDHSDYKQVALGLIFLKYITDAFEAKRAKLLKDELSDNVFWVPEKARWKFGLPPTGNANYAWLQHIHHHLAPGGTADMVLANGSMLSGQSGEGNIRRAMVETDVVDRTRRELAEEDIGQVARTYHAWRGEKDAGGYQDLPGFCRAATLEEVGERNYVLTPGRYVGAEATQDDGKPFEDKMQRLGTRWLEQQAQAVKLDAAIKTNLKSLGFDPEKA